MTAVEEELFEDYIETTTDPGNLLLALTIVFSVFAYALLPFLVGHAQRRRAFKNPTETGSNSRRDTDGEESSRSPPRVNIYGGQGQDGILTRLETINNQIDDDDDEGDAASAFSTASFVSSVLDARARAARRTALERRARDAENEVSVAQRSQASGSVTGKLGIDAVSTHDAADADEDVFVPIREISTSNWKSRLRSSIDFVLVMAEWDYETKRIWKLALPYVSEAVVTAVTGAANVAIIGHFLGTKSLAAYVTVGLFVGLTSDFLRGFIESMATLCSQAQGSGNRILVGNYIQLATVFFVALNIPFAFMWIAVIDDLMEWLGFDEETASIAKEYTSIIVFVNIIDGVNEVVHEILDIIGHEVYSTVVNVTDEALTTLAIVGIVLGRNPSLYQVGLVTLGLSTAFTVFNFVFVWYMRWCRKYYEGALFQNAFKNKEAVRMMLKTSSALCLGWLLAYGEWEILTIFASFLGPAEVAAWGLLGSVWEGLEQVTEAVADAAEVRCAYLIGSGKPYKARLSAYKSILMAFVASLLMTSVVFMIGDDLPRILTKDPTLQRMVAELIPLFGIGNIALTMGTMAWTLVGSQGRYHLSTAVGFVGSWLVTMPLAAFLGIVLDIDLQGQTFAVVIGYLVSGTMNTYFLLTSDWQKISDEVVKHNEMNDISVSDDDGDDSADHAE